MVGKREPIPQNTAATAECMTEMMQERRKQMKKIAIASCVVTAIVLAFAIAVMIFVLTPMNYYNYGIDMIYRHEYEDAIHMFERANGYKDSAEQIRFCEAMLNDNVLQSESEAEP